MFGATQPSYIFPFPMQIDDFAHSCSFESLERYFDSDLLNSNLYMTSYMLTEDFWLNITFLNLNTCMWLASKSWGKNLISQPPFSVSFLFAILDSHLLIVPRNKTQVYILTIVGIIFKNNREGIDIFSGSYHRS